MCHMLAEKVARNVVDEVSIYNDRLRKYSQVWQDKNRAWGLHLELLRAASLLLQPQQHQPQPTMPMQPKSAWLPDAPAACTVPGLEAQVQHLEWLSSASVGELDDALEGMRVAAGQQPATHPASASSSSGGNAERGVGAASHAGSAASEALGAVDGDVLMWLQTATGEQLHQLLRPLRRAGPGGLSTLLEAAEQQHQQRSLTATASASSTPSSASTAPHAFAATAVANRPACAAAEQRGAPPGAASPNGCAAAPSVPGSKPVAEHTLTWLQTAPSDEVRLWVHEGRQQQEAIAAAQRLRRYKPRASHMPHIQEGVPAELAEAAGVAAGAGAAAPAAFSVAPAPPQARPAAAAATVCSPFSNCVGPVAQDRPDQGIMWGTEVTAGTSTRPSLDSLASFLSGRGGVADSNPSSRMFSRCGSFVADPEELQLLVEAARSHHQQHCRAHRHPFAPRRPPTPLLAPLAPLGAGAPAGAARRQQPRQPGVGLAAGCRELDWLQAASAASVAELLAADQQLQAQQRQQAQPRLPPRRARSSGGVSGVEVALAAGAGGGAVERGGDGSGGSSSSSAAAAQPHVDWQLYAQRLRMSSSYKLAALQRRMDGRTLSLSLSSSPSGSVLSVGWKGSPCGPSPYDVESGKLSLVEQRAPLLNGARGNDCA